MNAWTPDIPIDDEIAQRLISSKFPELGSIELQFIGAGWDNHAYLVNRSLVFRIPHRKLGADLMANECVVLDRLNRHSLPLLIPDPQYVTPPASDFPYPIAGYPLIEGKTADSVLWRDSERAKSAKRLGAFLKALHRVDVDVPFALGDELKRADLPFRFAKLEERLKSAPPGFAALLDKLSKTSLHTVAHVWVHGDLYARHLVVDASSMICGVIDWGDVHVGDPALDIAIAWMFLPPNSWGAFLDAYGGVDEDTWSRARFRAMTHWLYISEYAAAQADEALLRECEFVLRNVMEGDQPRPSCA